MGSSLKTVKLVPLLFLFLLTSGFFVLLFNNFSILPVKAVSWLSGFNYRQSITIQNSTGSGANYQIPFNVVSGIGTTVNLLSWNISSDYNDIYLNNHATSNLQDIRFTSNDGTTLLNYWQQNSVNSVENTITNNMAISASWITLSGIIYAGDNAGHLYRISQDGTQMQLIKSISGSTNIRSVFVDSNGYIYFSPAFETGVGSNADSGLYRSINGGNFWTLVLPTGDINQYIWGIAQDKYGNIFAGIYTRSSSTNARIYKSSDNGATWTVVYYNSTARHIHQIAIDMSNNYIYASYGDSPNYGVVRSIDNGTTWVNILGSMPQVVSIFCGNGYRLFGSDTTSDGQIYRTTDDSSYSTVYDGTQMQNYWIRQDNVTGELFASFTAYGTTPVPKILNSFDNGLTWNLFRTLSGIVNYDGSMLCSNFINSVCYMNLYYDNPQGGGSGSGNGIISGLIYVRSSTFWVKIPDDLTSTNSTIYIYYGNPSATSLSSGVNTFLLYDNFSADSAVNWSMWQSSQYSDYTLSNGLNCAVVSDVSQLIQTINTYSGFSVECLIEQTDSGKSYLDNEPSSATWTGYDRIELAFDSPPQIQFFINGVENYISYSPTTNLFTFIYNCPSAGNAQGLVLLNSTLLHSYSNSPASNTVHISFMNYVAGVTIISYVFIRKYVASEPLITSVSLESVSIIATINASSLNPLVGQIVVFNSTISGGTSPYGYAWYEMPSGGTWQLMGAGSSLDTINWTFSNMGYYYVETSVSDSNGYSAISNYLTIDVIPSVSTLSLISFGITTTITGETATFYSFWNDTSYGLASMNFYTNITGSWASTTASLNYQISSGSNIDANATTALTYFSGILPIGWSIIWRINVTDANGNNGTTGIQSFIVMGLQVSISSSTYTPTLGQPISFSYTSNGVSPNSCNWWVDINSGGQNIFSNSNSPSYTINDLSIYKFGLILVDNLGGIGYSNNITITANTTNVVYLTVLSETNGYLSLSSNGVGTLNTGTYSYTNGTSLVIYEFPNNGYSFSYWNWLPSDLGYFLNMGSASHFGITLYENNSIQGIWVLTSSLTQMITVTNSIGGHLSLSSNNIIPAYLNNGNYYYSYGTNVTIYEYNDISFSFITWIENGVQLTVPQPNYITLQMVTNITIQGLWQGNATISYTYSLSPLPNDVTQNIYNQQLNGTYDSIILNQGTYYTLTIYIYPYVNGTFYIASTGTSVSPVFTAFGWNILGLPQGAPSWTTLINNYTYSNGLIVFGIDGTATNRQSTDSIYESLSLDFFSSLYNQFNTTSGLINSSILYYRFLLLTWQPPITVPPSGGFGQGGLTIWLIIFMLVGIPALILGIYFGRYGFMMGLVLGVGITYMSLPQYMPIWFIFLIGIALVMMLYGTNTGGIRDRIGI